MFGVHKLHSLGVLAMVLVDVNEVLVKSYSIGKNFVQISYEFVQIRSYGHHIVMASLTTFGFGPSLDVVGPFG